jgi:hypothetical protein
VQRGHQPRATRAHDECFKLMMCGHSEYLD